MNPFWNGEERRLRALWRLVVQAALAAVGGVIPILLIAEPLTALHRRGLFLAGWDHDSYDRVINMIVGPLFAIGIVASIFIAARFIDHRRVSDFGMSIDRAWWRGLALGFTIGGVVMSFIFAIEYALGYVTIVGSFQSNVASVSVGFAIAYSIVKVLCAATYEEAISRGYQLKNIAEGTSSIVFAVVATSAIFALLHLANENASALSVVGLFINALLFAAGLLITRRLSTAIGLHVAWNFFEGVVFGFPVSGDKEGASIIAIQQHGPALFTGGAFGPEAGIAGIVASLIGIALLALAARILRARG